MYPVASLWSVYARSPLMTHCFIGGTFIYMAIRECHSALFCGHFMATIEPELCTARPLGHLMMTIVVTINIGGHNKWNSESTSMYISLNL